MERAVQTGRCPKKDAAPPTEAASVASDWRRLVEAAGVEPIKRAFCN